MPRKLTAFQLFNQIKRHIPGGHKKGSLIISYLVRRGYIEKTGTNGFQLRQGVEPTAKDVKQLADEFLTTDP